MTQDWKKSLLFSMIFIIIFYKYIFWIFSNTFLFYSTVIIIILIFSFLYKKFLYFIKNINCFIKDILLVFFVSLFLSICFILTYLKIYYVMFIYLDNYYIIYMILSSVWIMFIVRFLFLLLSLPERKNG